MNETAVQSHVRAAFAHIGPVWRNNVGAAEDATGRLIRYGLGNDSAQLNRVIKSSDLIGITPVVIDARWLGYTVGVFTAIEVKRSDWRMPNMMDEHTAAQYKFHEIVRQAGGFAGFATSPGDIHGIIRR